MSSLSKLQAKFNRSERVESNQVWPDHEAFLWKDNTDVLEVKDSLIAGRGLFAKTDIKAGAFVANY